MQSLRAERPAQLLPENVWTHLAEPVQRAHRAGVEFHGTFRVDHGSGLLAKAFVRWSRLPPAAEKVETQLLIIADGSRTRWERSFAGHRLCTTQWQDDSGCFVERWGPIEIRFHLSVREGGLRYEQAGAALCLGPLRLPLPRRLAPRVEAREWPLEFARIGVRVSVALPLVGRFLAYEGEVQT